MNVKYAGNCLLIVQNFTICIQKLQLYVFLNFDLQPNLFPSFTFENAHQEIAQQLRFIGTKFIENSI